MDWPGPTAARGLGHAARGRRVQKILLVGARRGRQHHRRQVEQNIFRTGRNSSQDAIANAVALDKEGVSIVTMAQDSAFGKDGVKAFRKPWCQTGTRGIPAPATTDFTAGGQRMIDKLKGLPGRKVIFIIWAGGNPFKIADMDFEAPRHRDCHRRQHPARDGRLQKLPRHGRRDLHYFGIPKNPVNEALVANHQAVQGTA